MKRLLIFVLISSFVFLIPIANAAEFLEVKDKTKVIEENIEDDFYVIGEDSVVIKGNVKGDLVVVAGNVDVQGLVGSDLYVLGGNITVSGDVSGNVFMVGGQLSIKSYVEKNVFIAGGSITIDGEVGEDLNVAGGQISINNKIGDDVRVAGGSFILNGKIKDDLLMSVGNGNILESIGGDVFASGETIDISAKEIGGDLVFFGFKGSLITSNSLLVGGERVINEPAKVITPEVNNKLDFREIGILTLILKIIWNSLQIIGLIVLGYLLIKFAPIKTNLIVNNLKGFSNQIQSFGVGCISYIIGIFILMVLFISLIGIPVAKFLMALAFLSFTMITPLAGIALGRFFAGWFKQKYNHLLVLLIGITLIQLIEMVPVIGNIVGFYIYFLIIGAIVRWVYQKQQLNKIQVLEHKSSNENNIDEEMQYKLTNVKKSKKKNH